MEQPALVSLFLHSTLSRTRFHTPGAFKRLKEDVWHAEVGTMLHEPGHMWCCT